jgi:ribonuclease D
MNDGGMANPILITRQQGLKLLVEALAKERIVAVDTESNSLYAYQERVCLIQFSIPRGDYLVDPLAPVDLAGLGQVFADAGVEKVFHAAEYDILCLKRDYGFEFNNIFDTMAAARILGRKEVGLGAMLEGEFGVWMDKRYQRANWGQRPLPAPLLAYARLDTHYLIALRHRLKTALEENGRWGLAEDDFRRLCKVDGRVNGEEGGLFGGDPSGQALGTRPLRTQPTHSTNGGRRVRGAHELSPQQAAVLQELSSYREKAARDLDRPTFKVMGDQTLLALASQCPGSLEELRQIPGMSELQVRRHGGAILAALRRGQQARPYYFPRSPRPDERYLNRLEALRQWRKLRASELGVESDVILPKDLLFALAQANPRDEAGLAEVMGEAPWRLEQFGAQILEALRR